MCERSERLRQQLGGGAGRVVPVPAMRMTEVVLGSMASGFEGGTSKAIPKESMPAKKRSKRAHVRKERRPERSCSGLASGSFLLRVSSAPWVHG